MSSLDRLLGRVAPSPLLTTRDDMDRAIQQIVVPHLRSMGFRGSRPHFQRNRAAAIDLLTFQFSRWGGSFAVEIGRVAETGFEFHGRYIPAEKADLAYVNVNHRHRLGARRSGCDHWFKFEDRDPNDVANEVCAELDRQEPWALIDSWPVLGATPPRNSTSD